MDDTAVIYLFTASFSLCIAGLFFKACQIRREIQEENHYREQPVMIYVPVVPSAPPYDYVQMDEEPTHV